MDRQAETEKTSAAGRAFPGRRSARKFRQISGDEQLVKRVWEDVDALGYMYIWQVLLSF